MGTGRFRCDRRVPPLHLLSPPSSSLDAFGNANLDAFRPSDRVIPVVAINLAPSPGRPEPRNIWKKLEKTLDEVRQDLVAKKCLNRKWVH